MSTIDANLVEARNFRANLQTVLEAPEAPSNRSVADEAGIHHVTLSRILHGHIVPTMATASALARVCGYALPDLLVPPGKFSANISPTGVDSR